MFRDLTGQSILDKNNTCSTKCILRDTSKLKTENLMIVLYLVAIMLFTGWYFVYFIFVAMLISMTNNAESYGEHYNAIDHSNFRCDSVSSYGRLYNFFCFNIGYHQEHHVKPGLHWSRLPEITPTLPEKRTTIDTMYIFNLPYYKDFKELFK
jgi:fatty acid desaturase